MRIEQNFSSFPIDTRSVGPNAISKKSNNVVISSPMDFIFSWILDPYDSFPHIWSRDLKRFRFGRQGAPNFFFQTQFSRQWLELSPKFFQRRVPPNWPYLSSGWHGGQIWGPGPPKKKFMIFIVTQFPNVKSENGSVVYFGLLLDKSTVGVAESEQRVAAIFLLPVWPLQPPGRSFLPYSGLHCRRIAHGRLKMLSIRKPGAPNLNL